MLLAQSASASSSITMIIAYVILFGAIIYFMTIRPQKKQQKAAYEMHAGMQAGDSVLTTSGFYGVIIDIMDDTVIVEFGNNRNCRIPMQKDAIAAVEKPNLTKTEEEQFRLAGQTKNEKADILYL